MDKYTGEQSESMPAIHYGDVTRTREADTFDWAISQNALSDTQAGRWQSAPSDPRDEQWAEVPADVLGTSEKPDEVPFQEMWEDTSPQPRRGMWEEVASDPSKTFARPDKVLPHRYFSHCVQSIAEKIGKLDELAPIQIPDAAEVRIPTGPPSPGIQESVLHAPPSIEQMQRGSLSEGTWAEFQVARELLLQDAVADSILNGSFSDIQIQAYSQRGKLGVVHTPITVHARSSFLEAASPALRELSKTERRITRSIPAATTNYEYAEDSDLEDIMDDNADDRGSEISDIPSNASSDSWLNEPEENTEPDKRNEPYIAHRPLDTQVDQPEAIFVPDTAAKTYQALLLYLYNNRISFAPLKSHPSKPRPLSQRTACSPKSMYRLATKFELDELRKISENAILAGISSGNIVEELFSDFSWRYPNILAKQAKLFSEYAAQQDVRDKLNEVLKDVVLGKLPHGHIVLSALFEHFLPPVKRDSSV